MPPPPMPWMSRLVGVSKLSRLELVLRCSYPAMSIPALVAPPLMPLPRAKSATALISGHLRPATLAICAYSGWKAVKVRKYPLTNQMYRSPASSWALMYGRAVDVTVFSRAASSVAMQSGGKMAQNLQSRGGGSSADGGGAAVGAVAWPSSASTLVPASGFMPPGKAFEACVMLAVLEWPAEKA